MLYDCIEVGYNSQKKNWFPQTVMIKEIIKMETLLYND